MKECPRKDVKKKKNFTGRGRRQSSLGGPSPDVTGSMQKFPGETVSGVALSVGVSWEMQLKGGVRPGNASLRSFVLPHFLAPDNWQFGVSHT